MGLPVAVVGDSVQTATHISGGAQVITNSTSRDLWNMYAFNTTAGYATLSVEIGSPHCTMTIVVPPAGNGMQHIIANLPLPRNTSIKAYANHSNAVYLYGFAGQQRLGARGDRGGGRCNVAALMHWFEHCV